MTLSQVATTSGWAMVYPTPTTQDSSAGGFVTPGDPVSVLIFMHIIVYIIDTIITIYTVDDAFRGVVRARVRIRQ